MAYALVIYIFAGVFAKGDSVTVSYIPMESMQMCQQEGPKLARLTDGSAKEYRFVCIRTK